MVNDHLKAANDNVYNLLQGRGTQYLPITRYICCICTYTFLKSGEVLHTFIFGVCIVCELMLLLF